MNWKNFRWESILAMLIVSCGAAESPQPETRLAAVTELYITIKNEEFGTFLKKTVDTPTKEPSVRGKDYCYLSPNAKYRVYDYPEKAQNNHYLVNIVDFTDKGCGFSKGYVYAPHIKDATFSARSTSGSITGAFPIYHQPLADFTSGIRKFGANRDNGARKHAGSDLYSKVGRGVRAIADGVVTDYYYFYSGTHAAVVTHTFPDGKKRVVRYGEISGLAGGVKVGSRVKQGQQIAVIGKMNCCRPMLHFEYFAGTQSGPLTVRSGAFQRRGDLLNPETLLKSLIETL